MVAVVANTATKKIANNFEFIFSRAQIRKTFNWTYHLHIAQVFIYEIRYTFQIHSRNLHLSWKRIMQLKIDTQINLLMLDFFSAPWASISRNLKYLPYFNDYNSLQEQKKTYPSSIQQNIM